MLSNHWFAHVFSLRYEAWHLVCCEQTYSVCGHPGRWSFVCSLNNPPKRIKARVCCSAKKKLMLPSYEKDETASTKINMRLHKIETIKFWFVLSPTYSLKHLQKKTYSFKEILLLLPHHCTWKIKNECHPT
jgi:hypothetical protein